MSGRRAFGGVAIACGSFAIVVAGATAPATAAPDAAPQAPWLTDRGPGIRTSIFGTYVRRGELLVMPFAEYYKDDDFEYKPAELGFGVDEDFRGRFRATEGLIFLSYGLTDRIAIELEAAVIDAQLDKAPDDPSSMPARLESKGQGDWQVQLDATLVPETATRPEVFGFLEVVPPSNRDDALIGTADWEFKAGAGVTRGLAFGTVTLRAAGAYELEEPTLEVGEYAVEWLKRLSPRWRVYAGIEGEQDEVELIGEAQLFLGERVYLRLNSGFGLTSKATDWAPDVGVVFAIPIAR